MTQPAGPALPPQRTVYGRRWALIAALMLYSVNVSTTAVGAEANVPSTEKLQLLSNFFDNEVAAGNISGAIVLIQQHGRPVYLKTFGMRDVRTDRQHIDSLDPRLPGIRPRHGSRAHGTPAEG